MTPNFSAPACMHPSPVAALALRPSGACQTYQSPPQPPDRGEQTTGDTVVSAREDIEWVETGVGESERPIVSMKRGNHPEGPCGESAAKLTA